MIWSEGAESDPDPGPAPDPEQGGVCSCGSSPKLKDDLQNLTSKRRRDRSLVAFWVLGVIVLIERC